MKKTCVLPMAMCTHISHFHTEYHVHSFSFLRIYQAKTGIKHLIKSIGSKPSPLNPQVCPPLQH